MGRAVAGLDVADITTTVIITPTISTKMMVTPSTITIITMTINVPIVVIKSAVDVAIRGVVRATAPILSRIQRIVLRTFAIVLLIIPLPTIVLATFVIGGTDVLIMRYIAVRCTIVGPTPSMQITIIHAIRPDGVVVVIVRCHHLLRDYVDATCSTRSASTAATGGPHHRHSAAGERVVRRPSRRCGGGRPPKRSPCGSASLVAAGRVGAQANGRLMADTPVWHRHAALCLRLMISLAARRRART